MNKIEILHTKTTPQIKFDEADCTLKISGHSYPENSVEFYKPVLKWIKEWLETKPKKPVVEFKLEYFNTSSSKSLLDIFDLLEDFHQNGAPIQVKWLFQEDDEDMKDSGEDFAEDLNIPFKIESYK